MKYFFALIIVFGIAIGFLLKTPEKKSKPGYVFEVLPAPANALEYPPVNAVDHGSGLYSQVLEPAINDLPLRGNDIVAMSYDGWSSPSGYYFDSNKKAGDFLRYRVNFGGFMQPIEGWKRIIPMMKEGEKRRVWIPNSLGYGPNASAPHLLETLVFDMKVEEVKREVRPPLFNRFPVEPTSEAITQKSGLISLLITEGDEGTRPKPTDIVRVQLSIWDKDGTLVRSTEQQQVALQLSLEDTLPVLSEALQLMKVEDTWRFWIKKELGYGASDGPALFPRDGFIADIKLLEICLPFDNLVTPPAGLN